LQVLSYKRNATENHHCSALAASFKVHRCLPGPCTCWFLFMNVRSRQRISLRCTDARMSTALLYCCFTHRLPHVLRSVYITRHCAYPYTSGSACCISVQSSYAHNTSAYPYTNGSLAAFPYSKWVPDAQCTTSGLYMLTTSS